MSGASTWNPAAPRGSIWCRHEYAISGKPCMSSTSGPSGGPDSRQKSRTPLVTTKRPFIETKLTGTTGPRRDVRCGTATNGDAGMHQPKLYRIVGPAIICLAVLTAAGCSSDKKAESTTSTAPPDGSTATESYHGATIVVAGHGKVSGTPDTMTMSIGVSTT